MLLDRYDIVVFLVDRLSLPVGEEMSDHWQFKVEISLLTRDNNLAITFRCEREVLAEGDLQDEKMLNFKDPSTQISNTKILTFSPGKNLGLVCNAKTVPSVTQVPCCRFGPRCFGLKSSNHNLLKRRIVTEFNEKS